MSIYCNISFDYFPIYSFANRKFSSFSLTLVICYLVVCARYKKSDSAIENKVLFTSDPSWKQLSSIYFSNVDKPPAFE